MVLASASGSGPRRSATIPTCPEWLASASVSCRDAKPHARFGIVKRDGRDPPGYGDRVTATLVLSTTSDTPRKRTRPGQKSDPSGHFFAAWDIHEWCPNCRSSQGHNCTEQKPCPISSNWTLDMWARLSKSRTYKSRASSAAGKRASSVVSGVSASARSTSSQASSSASGVSHTPRSHARPLPTSDVRDQSGTQQTVPPPFSNITQPTFNPGSTQSAYEIDTTNTLQQMAGQNPFMAGYLANIANIDDSTSSTGSNPTMTGFGPVLPVMTSLVPVMTGLSGHGPVMYRSDRRYVCGRLGFL